MEKIRVLVGDDHAVVRAGIKQIIDDRPDMECVGEADDGQSVMREVKQHRPDAVILDIAMPKMSGLELIPLIKEVSPHTRVIIFSMFKKEAYAHQALAAGAMGYVLKTSPSTEVVDAVQMAMEGKFYLSPDINTEVIQSYLQGKNEPSKPTSFSKYDLLSEREQQVFRLVIEGNSTRQIAEMLCISAKTTEKHRSNIIRKLGISDPMAMLKFAIKIGIADPDLWTD